MQYSTPLSLLCEPLMLNPRYSQVLIDEASMLLTHPGHKANLADGVAESDEPTVEISLYNDAGNMLEPGDTDQYSPKSLVAVVPLHGVITRHGYVGWFSSAPGTVDIGRHLQALDRDESVGTIVTWINTPGGSVYGTPELAEVYFDIRKAGNTRTISVVDPMMASAGTYIGTAAEEVYAIPSADVGSIGVIASYTDFSKMLEEKGIKTEYFRIPENKARYTGSEPMTDDMREKVIDEIAESYDWFIRDMARNRGVSEKYVKEHFGKGGLMSASEAVDEKLIDGIKSLDDVVGELAAESRESNRGQRRKMASERLKEAMAADEESVDQSTSSTPVIDVSNEVVVQPEPEVAK